MFSEDKENKYIAEEAINSPSLKYNLDSVEQRISAACKRSGRKRNEVTLIAVSKTKPISMIYEAYEVGIRHFGENKVQELLEKCNTFSSSHGEVEWHLLGHLQRNKVKYIIDKVSLIHSVDSLRLGLQIEEEAAKKGIQCDILIEVNIAAEETKYGVRVEELLPLVNQLADLPHINIRGLMAIAPYVTNPEQNRMYFREMRELFIDIRAKNIDNEVKYKLFNILSMGMTGDFEVAIEEGATMVRVGTGIFGERSYIV